MTIANDLFIYCGADINIATWITCTFKEFQEVSALVVNNQKSESFFCGV